MRRRWRWQVFDQTGIKVQGAPDLKTPQEAVEFLTKQFNVKDMSAMLDQIFFALPADERGQLHNMRAEFAKLSGGDVRAPLPAMPNPARARRASSPEVRTNACMLARPRGPCH